MNTISAQSVNPRESFWKQGMVGDDEEEQTEAFVPSDEAWAAATTPAAGRRQQRRPSNRVAACWTAPSPGSGLALAMRDDTTTDPTEKGDLVVVCGSLYVVAAAREHLACTHPGCFDRDDPVFDVS